MKSKKAKIGGTICNIVEEAKEEDEENQTLHDQIKREQTLQDLIKREQIIVDKQNLITNALIDDYYLKEKMNL
jgi:hypothetical protein